MSVAEDEQFSFQAWLNRNQNRPKPSLQPVSSSSGNPGYGQAALTAELQQLLDTTEGQRNDQLNKSAFSLAQLVASGHLPDTETQDQLRNAALHVGLTPSEVDATLRSAFRAGSQQPRDVQLLQTSVTEVTQLRPPTNDTTVDPARTSWWPQPISERAEQAAEAPVPTHLVRDDGQPLCYSNKVNGLIGESESGKSWVALLAVVQALAAGQRVLFLDFEDSPAAIHGRLHTLGVTNAQLDQLDYANPDQALDIIAAADLEEALTNAYALIIVDGINAAMTLLGYDLGSNTDATTFFQKLLRPLSAGGACVITVDHVPKNSEQRGKGGIGAQAKRAMTDGCTLLVEILEPFGKGQSGTLRLTVDKDRPGHVRGASSNSTYAGRAHLDSVSDQVRLRIVGPDMRPADERPHWRPTAIMERISRELEKSAAPLSGREVIALVNSRDQLVRQALAELVSDGHIKVGARPGRGGGQVYEHVSPYRDSEPDIPEKEVRPSASQVSPGRGSESASQSPSPFRDGTHFDGPPDAPQNGSASGTHLPLEHPEGWADCNRCGQPTDPETLDDTAGYCRNCGRVMNP